MYDAGQPNVPLAIVGMSCRLPGARDLDEFWRLILSGGDATGELPEDLLDRDLYYDPRRGIRGKSYTTKGGLVPRLPFDNDKCKLAPEIIENFDTAQLTACEVAYDALRDAGYDPHAIPAMRSGVFFGHTGGGNKGGDIVYSVYVEEVSRMLREVGSLDCLSPEKIDQIAKDITSDIRQRYDHRNETPDLDCSPNNLARIIAAAYHLDGPCVVVDAACASSLQALALGARSLRLGEADMVVVGGASCCKSDSLVLFSAAQSVSADKSCPFDENASGLVTAEGYVTLVLKTLPQAVADGDRIRCLIRGIGMSADGRGKSLWAPRKEGQAIAMQRAYPAPLKPEDVQFIEAHATSTQVGDATELAALAAAYPESLAGNRKIPLGSVKANVGHTLETAGVAGLAKAVLAMEQHTIPPVANLTKPNSTVAWDKMPFYLPMEPEPWKRPGEGIPRRAAVNSFGIGGLNVHILLEEYLPSADDASAKAVRPTVQPKKLEPIAVIGTGTILPGANNTEAYWQLLESGQNVITEVSPERWNAEHWVDPTGETPYRALHARGGFITDYKYDWRRHRVPPKQIANANPLQFMLLDATEQALEEAGYLKKEFDRERVGVVVGTVFGGDFAAQLQAGLRLPEYDRFLRRHLAAAGVTAAQADKVIAEYDELVLKRMPALLDETGSFTSSTLASRITKTFDFKGGALAMDAAHGSGLAALGACINILRTDECDMMICATGQRNADMFTFEALTRVGCLSSPGQKHTFDAGAGGFVPGEGCGAVLLKRLSDAQRDGDRVLAILHEPGVSSDWQHPGAAEQKALQRALNGSGIQPADVDFMETLAGQEVVAKTELEEIGRQLASEPRERPIQVNALVSQFGYLGAAHGMAGVIKGILSIKHGRYPAGKISQHPNSHLPFSDSVQPQQSTSTLPRDRNTAIGISCGGEMGPTYVAFVEPFSEAVSRRKTSTIGQATPAEPAASTCQIVRVGSQNMQSLLQRLRETPADQLYDPQYVFSKTDRARLAIVCRNAADFAEKVNKAAADLPEREAWTRGRLSAHGIYFGEPSPFASKIAFVFPGQGSQYAGMLSQLIQELPEARTACRRADAAMEALGYDPFDAIAGPQAKDLGKDIWKTQISMLLADCILEDTLRQLGLTASVVTGHSFGEYAALVCAGVWSLTDAIRATRHRYQSIVETSDGTGAMAAVKAPPEDVEPVLAQAGEGVFMANLNGPEQTVIAGGEVAVTRAIELLKKAGLMAMMIKVPCPFHTPLMAPTARSFGDRLQEIPLRDASIPVVSTASGEPILSAQEVRQSLIGQLTQPVPYGTMLNSVLEFHPALVVEVGPRQTLTQLNGKNHTADDVIFQSCDIVRRPGAVTLMGVLAQADCLGCLETQGRQRQVSLRRAEDRLGRLLEFDATERRTTRMRAQAKTKTPKTSLRREPVPVGSQSSAGAAQLPSAVKAKQSNTPAARATTTSAPQPSPDPVAAQPVATPLTASTPKPTASAAREELREILVGFVVEQTGYPEDIVELDADLEADLGIDSIKKAQLFGEVGERFQIAPRADLSLDDFPTLNHVLDFLVEELGSADRDQAVSDETASSAVNATSTPAVADDHPPRREDPPAGKATGPSREELHDILVGFVVEQTGYPEDIVEFDADLEADLGIDSIKKAQLFGEVGERFQIAPRADLSLDDFPTLGHVLDFLVEELGSADNPADAFDPIGVVSNAVETPPPAANAASAPQVEDSSTNSTTGPSREELHEILVGFVVEQTGYPEDIVELDADLEADLGIDSIKKAQLFGEVGERFQIAPREDLSLDDFPTLSHVLDFLVAELGGAGSSPTEEHVAKSETSDAHDDRAPCESTPASTTTRAVYVQVLEGESTDFGYRHGRELRQTIQRELATVIETSLRNNGTPATTWPEPLQAELAALAEQAEVNQGAVTAWNRLAEPLSALRTTFDAASTQPLPPFLRHSLTLVQVRKPAKGAQYLTIGRPGRVSVPVGLNHAGLAISCEPLGTDAIPEDVISLTHWMHRELTSSQVIGDATEALRGLKLRGQWSVGIGSPSSPATRFWLCESGQTRSIDSGATPEQVAFHRMLERDPKKITLADRQNGVTEQIDLNDWLPRAEPQTPAPVEVETVAPTQSVMRRHILRMAPAPRPKAGVRLYDAGSRVCLIGDSDLTDPLRVQLEATGCQVTELGNAAMATAFESENGAELPTHLILLSESSADASRLDDFTAIGHVEGLFHACRRWIAGLEQTNRIAGSSLVAVTRMGGDFAFHSSAQGFTGGCLTGLLKGIRREYPALRTKVLDFAPGESPQVIAAELPTEVNSACTELEIGFRSGQRLAVQAVAALAPEGSQQDLRRGGVWVITGGGRGVTFAVARELARRYDLRLHLLGTAPPPNDAQWRGKSEEQLRELRRDLAIQARREGKNPGEPWRHVEKAMELDRNLKQLAADGLKATYHACDVGNREALATVLRDIRTADGPIDGILHGAGVESACRFSRKKEASVRATIAAKCDGAANLIALTRQDPLECFVAFGSTSGRFGGLGQADYSLASDLLAKMTDRLAFERPECTALTFHWPAWDEVGMAVRPESRMALERGGIAFMPVAEGIDYLLAELRSPKREREILILDKPDLLDTDGTMTRRTDPCDPLEFHRDTEPGDDVSHIAKESTRRSTSGGAETLPLDASRASLIDSIGRGNTPGSYEATLVLDASQDPFLVHHNFRGKPFLPGVMSMEMFAEAALLTRPGAVFRGTRDLQLINGWSMAPDRKHEARIVMQDTKDGVHCELRGMLHNSRGEVVDRDRLYASATIELGSETSQIESVHAGAPIMSWTPFFYPENVAIQHGPPLRTFKQLDFIHGGGRAILSCGPWQDLLGERQGTGAEVAAAILDGCMVACGTYSYFMVNQRIEIPKAIAVYRQSRLPRPDEMCTLRFFLRESNRDGNVYDFTVIGDEGEAILQVERYQSVQPTEME